MSLPDMSGARWDVKRTYLVYESARPLAPGQHYARTYSIKISDGLLSGGESSKIPSVVAMAQQWEIPDLMPNDGTISESEIPVRGHLTELLKSACKDIDLCRRYLESVAQAKGNTIIFYHDPVHVAQLRDHAIDPSWWTKSELRDLVAYANSLGITVIPGMWSKFRGERFKAIMSPENESNFYCPSNEAANQEFFSFYDKLLDIYRPEKLLVGHDEILGLKGCVHGGETTAELLTKDLRRIHTWMKGRGVQMMIWGDMLLSAERWNGVVGSAHGNDEMFGEIDSDRVLAALPCDVLILDWHYEVHSDYPSIGYLTKLGFQVCGAAWYKSSNALN